MARDSRLWQDSIAHIKFFEGDINECTKWYAWARQKLSFMLHNAPGAATQIFTPVDNVTIKVDTRPNRIYINAGDDPALTLQLAANSYEEGWGKPYGVGLGTPGGYNPWTILKTNPQGTAITTAKGLPANYFTDKNEIAYSLTPNIGNCYWGVANTGLLTWIGPVNQIGPVVIDGDSSYGGTITDAQLDAPFQIGSPTHYVYVQDQFGKKVFKNKAVVAQFPNYVLAACESSGSGGPCIIALTATSLNQCAGLQYKIEVFWVTTNTYTVAKTIDMAAEYALFPMYAGAFNLAATKCTVAFQLNYLFTPPTSPATAIISTQSKVKVLSIDLTNLSVVTHSVAEVPKPVGYGTDRRLESGVGYSSPTSVYTWPTMLGYGYNYASDALEYAYLVNSYASYFTNPPYITSYLQVGSNIKLIGSFEEPHYAFSYSILYGSVAPTGGSWFYPDVGLSAFDPTVVYCNVQRGQIGIFYWVSTGAHSAATPVGSVMPVRVSGQYHNHCVESDQATGILSDDYLHRNEVLGFGGYWPLGNSNDYTNPDKTTFITGSWVFTTAPTTVSEIKGCGLKINGVQLTTGTTPNTNYLAPKYNSNLHTYFNGVSNKKYAFGSFDLKGPFIWYYQTDFTFPMPSDYAGNFKAYLQSAKNTTSAIPTGYRPMLNTGDLGLTGQSMPRIKRSRIL